MEDKNLVVAACVLVIAVETRKRRNASIKKKIKRKLWSQKWLLRRQKQLGYGYMAMNEFQYEDMAAFQNFTRMSLKTFLELRDKVRPLLLKQDTVMREAINVETKLICTLRFLATGQKFKELSYGFRVSVAAISLFIPEVLAAISTVVEEFLQVPKTQCDWENVAEGFEQKWNFPNCLGAIDGKHIAIKARTKDGSYYYNYKGFNSLILLAAVDADYKFIYACIGGNGRANDAAVFNESSLGVGIRDNVFNFPENRELPGTIVKVPYVFVADEAFRLSDRILKPNGERSVIENRIFNYRLSRARRIVENAFGILAAKFQIFQSEIDLPVHKVEDVVLAACGLYNFIRTRDGKEKVMVDVENVNTCTITQGQWRNQVCITGLQRASGNRTGDNARRVRDIFTQYFNTVGSVPWQNKAINKFNF